MAHEAHEVVDRFFSVRLGITLADLKPGQVAVATCERRTVAERGYGVVRLLWIVHLGDRAAVSVHPAGLAEVSTLTWGLTPDDVVKDDFCTRAAEVLQAALHLVDVRTQSTGVILYHPGTAAPVLTDGQVRWLTPTDADKWVGERAYLPAPHHPSALRREAIGLFLGDRLVAEAITHDLCVSEMMDLVAEDGIEVAEAYRRQGHGRALLAAWTCEMQARSRVCIHSTIADNKASVALAGSVGYLEYARTRAVTV